MTITPTGASPAPGAVVAGAVAVGSSDGGFADLVRQHLESGSDGSSEENAGGLLTSEQAAALLEAASAPSAVPSDGLAALLAGLLSGSTLPRADAARVSAVVPETDVTAPVGIVATLPASGGTAPGAVLPDAFPVSLGAAPAVTGSAPVPVEGLHAATATGASVPNTAAAASTPLAQVDQPAQAVAAPLDGAIPEKAGAISAPLLPGDAASATVASSAEGAVPSPVSSQAPASLTAASGTVGVTGSAEGSTSHPVTDQVFGQVTRLVSRGDGTHRLTLRLHPADLGEVKVVLTVKDGAVDVSLSAGPAAREALRDGSPQLRALLELAGATTAHVVVRDAAGNAVPPGAGGHQATGQQPSGAGAGDAHDQGADPELASQGGLADGTTDGSRSGNGDADTGAAPAPGLSGPGALAGVRLRHGDAAPSGATEPAQTGIPARLDLNL